jgi:hypothetical protein
MNLGLHLMYPLFLSNINAPVIFLERFSKDTPMSNFMKIRQVGAELFHADRSTDIWTGQT